ncbi:amidohydrolase [Pseudoroseomonas ludipueritiae]|uniref:Amidohydrolase n=1 Tax=Pseudoroseomonas ludipueritiae TaxID=198093 RepID=A0ABR7R782_9PROT|nr:amidohydrolase [Pseudoroseomonas ludipueritiae]MBC9177622.1 amidohydrolase [Pseudoroseomonas ludipueritiae]
MSTELLISGGRIFRGLRGGFAEALAVRDGRVVAVGTEEDVSQAVGAAARRIDLAGRVAMPALNEAHMHLAAFGLTLTQVNLRAEEVRTLDEVLKRVGEAAKRVPKGQWISGRGYDHGELDIGRHPLAEELDRVAPDNPVFIVRTCGHVGVANSMAMKLAGVSHNTPNPEGGAIERKNGRLTGLFAERAMRMIKEAMPACTEAQLVDAIDKAGQKLASYGFASASDMNIGMTAGMAEVAAYHQAEAEGRLHQRMWQVLFGNPEGIAQQAWEAGIRPGIAAGATAESLLAWGGMKVFGDGSAGGLTAAFFDPYLESAGGGTGIFCFPDDAMHEMLSRYHRQGWQLDIHAIGDAAIEQVLSGMEKADAPDAPIAGRRHRIEHCGFLNRNQRQRMLRHGILPVPQPVFMYEFGDLYVTNLGQERAAAAYPMATWLHEGHHPAASSDSPVCTVDPFPNLYTMVTRKTNKGTVLGAEEVLTMEEAVHCYTWCGAFSQFAEGERGTLEPGQQADIAILSRDIFAEAPEALFSTQADMTFRGGRAIFDRHGEVAALSAALC